MKINTVNGPIDSSALGRALMHEHLVVGLPGWESDTAAPAPDYRNLVAACVDRVQELKDSGFSSMLDPCPNDLGRDVNLMAEVSSRTGLNIIFATGLYNEHMGGSPYWKLVSRLDADADKRLCDMFVGEIEKGVGGTGMKPGVIKVGTAEPPFSNYERMVFRAAAMASIATNTRITTHTEGVLGDEQVAYLVEHGVEASGIIVGHCCGSADHAYHMKIAKMGAFMGFDRFGVPYPHSDENRVKSILKLKEMGAFKK